MNLQYRIDLLVRLGQYILSAGNGWQKAKETAGQQNAWFIPEFIDLAAANIAKQYLDRKMLENLANQYKLQTSNADAYGQYPDTYRHDFKSLTVGVVMAGNIPLVGFHDFLCVFISGHKIKIKPSSKDDVLIKHLVEKLLEWNEEITDLVQFEEMLKGCDAYIATGSNNSSRYFDYYFGKYPHIIRRNRTSAAILDGAETNEELEKLADDVHLFFGLGCRNVTKIYVPDGYDFVPLLAAFSKYKYFADHHKYKNNFDYRLALHMLNNKFYMTNGSVILFENKSLFSPISQLNYEFYKARNEVAEELKSGENLQCIVGHGFIPFGRAQCPDITDYADGVDTLEFLTAL